MVENEEIKSLLQEGDLYTDKTNDELVEALRKNIGDKDITVRRNSEQLKENKDAEMENTETMDTPDESMDMDVDVDVDQDTTKVDVEMDTMH